MLELPRGVTRAREKIKYQIVSMSNMRDAGHTFVSKVQHRLSCEATDQYVSAIVAGSRNSSFGFSFGNQARVRGLCARCGAGVFRNIPSKTLATFGSGRFPRWAAGWSTTPSMTTWKTWTPFGPYVLASDCDSARTPARELTARSGWPRIFDVQDTCCGDAAAKRII